MNRQNLVSLDACNTIDGIRGYLRDGLPGLHDLVRDRRAIADADRAEQNQIRLKEFTVQGQWRLDARGQVLRVFDVSFDGRPCAPNRIPGLPDVIDADGLTLFGRGVELFFSISYAVPALPPWNVSCSECGVTWTLETAADFTVARETRVVDVTRRDELRLLPDFMADYHRGPGEICRLSTSGVIRNDRWIDTEPMGDRPHSGGRCPRGWLFRSDYGDGADSPVLINVDAYRLQHGDQVSVEVETYRHKTCAKDAERRVVRCVYQGLFGQAGFHVTRLDPAPNGYSQGEHAAPWFRVETDIGAFVVGLRRNVFHLAWSEATPKDLQDLFRDKKVTKGAGFIHCWNRDELLEALKRLRKELAPAEKASE